MDEIICNNCGWTGLTSELFSKTTDINDRDFKYCPLCDSDDIEDIESIDE